MRIDENDKGDLVLTLEENEASRSDWQGARAGDLGVRILEIMGAPSGFALVPPEAIGALTDSPILVRNDDYTGEDNGTFKVYENVRVWWFPSYQIEDPIETLREKGTVTFEGVVI